MNNLPALLLPNCLIHLRPSLKSSKLAEDAQAPLTHQIHGGSMLFPGDTFDCFVCSNRTQHSSFGGVCAF